MFWVYLLLLAAIGLFAMILGLASLLMWLLWRT